MQKRMYKYTYMHTYIHSQLARTTSSSKILPPAAHAPMAQRGSESQWGRMAGSPTRDWKGCAG